MCFHVGVACGLEGGLPPHRSFPFAVGECCCHFPGSGFEDFVTTAWIRPPGCSDRNSLTTTGRARFIPHQLPPGACPRLGDSRGTRGAGGSGTAGTLGSGWLSGSPREWVGVGQLGQWGAGGSQDQPGQQLAGTRVKPRVAAETQAGCLRWFLWQPEKRQRQQTSEVFTTA